MKKKKGSVNPKKIISEISDNQTPNQKRTTKKILSTIILGLAIVLFWRGAWGLMDVYLFPKSIVLSYTISLFLGIFILYLTKNLIDKLV